MLDDPIRVAILDLYDGTPNLGMANLRALVKAFPELSADVFDVRQGAEVPDLSYDIYLFSGGPGDPRETKPVWSTPFFGLINDLWAQQDKESGAPKHTFFICHSFQMLCWHFKLGKISRRRTRAFGVFPAHKSEDGISEPLISDLPDPFYVADFRDYQVTTITQKSLDRYGARIIAWEKIRPHVPLDRAVMAVRFSESWFGTQFHPEASPTGMMERFAKPEKQDEILQFQHPDKYHRMMTELKDPRKLALTQMTILPRFFRNAIDKIQPYRHLPSSGSVVS